MRKFLLLPIAMLLSSCEGIFDGIYDEAPTDDTFVEGFHRGTSPNAWTLQLDATSYDEWIYVDLHAKTLDRRPIPRSLTGEWDGRSGITYQLVEGSRYTKLSEEKTDPQSAPESWDFAIHHFDVKTNGGTVAISGSDDFVADEWSDNQVIVDMRQMMGYIIGYQNSSVSRVLSSWVTMDISTPPPIFTASGATYTLRMPDGTEASMHLRSYMSDRGTKGYLTIEIVYPL